MSRDLLGLCTKRSGISESKPQNLSITRHSPEGWIVSAMSSET